MKKSAAGLRQEPVRDLRRELGRVRRALFERDEGRQMLVAEVIIEFGDGGAVQSMMPTFASLTQLNSFRSDVLRLFGVRDEKNMVGRECYALRPTAKPREMIVGLEVDGRRLTFRGWARRAGLKTSTGLEERREELRRKHSRLIQQLEATTAELKALAAEYVEWEDTL